MFGAVAKRGVSIVHRSTAAVPAIKGQGELIHLTPSIGRIEHSEQKKAQKKRSSRESHCTKAIVSIGYITST